MRGSDAGDASGQGLIAGSIRGQGLLTRQAESNMVPPIVLRRVSWIDPIDDSRMVRDSIARWNGARLRARLQRQQLQGHRRWYLVVDGTVLLQQQQGHMNGYLGCTWLRQATRRPGIQAKQQGCMLVRRGLQQWQQEQSHRLDMPRRPSTQAKRSGPIGRQNYSVPRPHSVGQVPRMDDSCGTKDTHRGPASHNG